MFDILYFVKFSKVIVYKFKIKEREQIENVLIFYPSLILLTRTL